MNSNVTGERGDVKKTLSFSLINSFEPRHENKSCSACLERVNERVKE